MRGRWILDCWWFIILILCAFLVFKVPSVIGMTNNNVVTLSWLLAQDIPQAYIFTERPSTFNRKAAFINDKKYVVYDYLPSFTEDSKHLKAMKSCPVAGSKFPILVTRDINPLIREVRSSIVKIYVNKLTLISRIRTNETVYSCCIIKVYLPTFSESKT